MKKQLGTAIIALGVTLGHGAAASTIIDFEGFAKGTIIDNEYAAQGVTITGVNLDQISHSRADNIGVIFDTDANNTADPDLEAPFNSINGQNLGVANPGNVLIIHEHPWECNDFSCGSDPDDEGSRPAGYFDIVFDQAVTLNSIDFFDVEYGENGNSYKNLITVSGNGTYDPFYTPYTGGDNTWGRLNFNLVGVTSLRIKVHGSGAIDNINFDYAMVPEPPIVALLLLGLGMIGFTRRQRALSVS